MQRWEACRAACPRCRPGTCIERFGDNFHDRTRVAHTPPVAICTVGVPLTEQAELESIACRPWGGISAVRAIAGATAANRRAARLAEDTRAMTAHKSANRPAAAAEGRAVASLVACYTENAPRAPPVA